MPQPGYARSPFQEGFSFLREEPLLLPSELMWRWCFALAFWLAAFYAAALFLDSLSVSAVDRFLLRTLNPAFESTALSHVFRGALPRYLWLKFVVLASATVLWAFAAAVGRAAALRNLISLAGGADRDEDAGWQFAAMFQLHLLRAAWAWIALACLLSSLLLGSTMFDLGRPARGAFFYVFGVALSVVFGLLLNWLLGLAPLFCIRDQVSAREALSLAIDFCSRQAGRLFGLSLVFLALRLFWFGAMFFLVLAPTNLGKHIALGWVLLMMFALFLIYLAGADALSLARLGSFATLADIDSHPEPLPPPAPDFQPWTPATLTPPSPPSVEWNPDPNPYSPSA